MGVYSFINCDYVFIYSVDIGNGYSQEQTNKILNYILKKNKINAKKKKMKGFTAYINMDKNLFDYIVPFDFEDAHPQNKLISFMIGPLKNKLNDKEAIKLGSLYIDLKKHSSKRLLNLLNKCYKLAEE